MMPKVLQYQHPKFNTPITALAVNLSIILALQVFNVDAIITYTNVSAAVPPEVYVQPPELAFAAESHVAFRRKMRAVRVAAHARQMCDVAICLPAPTQHLVARCAVACAGTVVCVRGSRVRRIYHPPREAAEPEAAFPGRSTRCFCCCYCCYCFSLRCPLPPLLSSCARGTWPAVDSNVEVASCRMLWLWLLCR